MRTKNVLWLILPALAAGGLASSSGMSCSDDSSGVVAKQIQTRADLIGGPGALGDVGDYLLANEQIRVIIQGPGYSRGFGIYGGSLIDADLQRPETFGDSAGGHGLDNFSELFPALFLKAMRPSSIETSKNDDGSASITVLGSSADFVFLAKRINEALVDSEKVIFKNVYTLHPGKRYVEITTTVTNGGESAISLPDEGIASLIPGDKEFVFPVGDVILFGAGNDVFSEHAGFDMRFSLEQLYRDYKTNKQDLPQLPGLVTPFLATKGEGVSYGFMSGIEDPESSFVSRTRYEGASAHDMLVPFIAAAFTGAYYNAPPTSLGSRESFTFKKFFMVGRGDVASIRDVVHDIRGVKTGELAGVVKTRFDQAPEVGVSVLTFDASGGPYNQHTTDANGQFKGSYAPGQYSYRVLAPGRFPTRAVPFEIKEGASSFVEIELESPGFVNARVVGEDGEPIPSRCSLVGVYPAPAPGIPGHEFLYDLGLGEHPRAIDLVDDTDDPMTRRYVEQLLIMPNGRALEKVRPGHYRAYCSRGMEYDVYEQDIDVTPRGTVMIDGLLKRVVDTAGWASGDFHLHSVNSVDSSMGLNDRVTHVAAEGVDIACSSDHNFVTDYTRAISSQGLEKWVQGMVGLEMTTIEIGHFNGFPLRYDVGPITKGAFEWSGRPPADLFNDIRGLGAYGPSETIVQVNHPRDTILGYFNDYNFNPDTGEAEDSDSLFLSPEGPEFGKDKFTLDFDAIELFNGKRYDLMRHYRVPAVLPKPPLPDVIPPAGTILRDSSGKVAYPGGLDDWFTLLNQGHISTAMGNSDTHEAADEPGIPRTFMPVSEDTPGGIPELDVVHAIQAGNTLPTNGPFTRIAVLGDGRCFDRRSHEPLGHEKCGMGEVAVADRGKVTIEVDTQTAPWVKIDRVNFIVNGETVATVEGDRESLQKVTRDITVSGDSWLLVEVSGEESMFPVIVPRELPSIQIGDALGSVAGAFGFSLSPFGNLKPSDVTTAKPYAFTNPVFIDSSSDGVWDPPGTASQALTAATAPRMSMKKSDFSALPAIVKMFSIFSCGHAH